MRIFANPLAARGVCPYNEPRLSNARQEGGAEDGLPLPRVGRLFEVCRRSETRALEAAFDWNCQMPKSAPSPVDTAAALLAKPLDFDTLMSKLGARDKVNVERHMAACETEGKLDHLRLWRRLATDLFTLAPHAVQTIGQQVLQFFIADGKYKMQVFALEDQRDGNFIIYCVDVMKAAFKHGLLVPQPKSDTESHDYVIKDEGGQKLTVEMLDANNTPNPAAWYKHMLGWNRKALRITLTVGVSPAQISAAEKICGLATLTFGKS